MVAANFFATSGPQTGSKKKTGNAERRAEVRFPTYLDAICWDAKLNNGEPWTALVKDISSGGVGLVCRRPVAPGDIFYLKLQSNYVDLSGPLRVTCVHAHQEDKDGWRVGCQFG